MDIASLKVSIDSKDAVTAKTAVDQLAQSGAKAEQSLKKVEQSSKTAGAGMRDMGALARSAQGALAAMGISVGLGALINQINEANRTLDEMVASTRRLEAASRLAGVEHTTLVGVAARAREEYLLSGTAANEYATSVARAADRIGDFGLAQEGLAAVMIIAAQEGIEASRALNAFRQALIGVDEGTDLLLGKNPSELFDATADSAERAEAVITALVDKAAELGGTFQESITEIQRAQAEANRSLEDAQLAFAEAYSPTRLFIIEAYAAAMEAVAGAFNLIQGKPGGVIGSLFGIEDPVTPAGATPESLAHAQQLIDNDRQRREREAKAAAREREKAARDAAVAAAKEEAALAAQVDLLVKARDLGIDRAAVLVDILELEAALRGELERGNVSRERAVFLAEQLAKLPSFDPAAPRLSIPGQVTPGSREEFLSKGGTLERQRDPQASADAMANLAAESIRTFNEQIAATQAIISAFGDLAGSTLGLSDGMRDALRGMETIAGGIGRFKAAGELGGFLGTAGQFSAALSIGAGAAQLIDALINEGEAERARQREEVERATEALRAFTDSLRDASNLERQRERAGELFGGAVNASQGGRADVPFITETAEELIRAGATTEEVLRGIADGLRATGDDIGAITTAIEEYRAALQAIEEARQREVERVMEDVQVRLLSAQGRDEEAEALRLEIQRKEELARARALEDNALVQLLQTLYEMEDAALAAAKAEQEAAAAQEANARAAERVAAAAEAAAAAQQAQASFIDRFQIQEQEGLGNTFEAELLRIDSERRQAINEALALGLGPDIIARIEDHFARVLAGVERDPNAVGGGLGSPSAGEDAVQNEIVRHVTGITATQATRLTDINLSQLSVLQEIAVNTRGFRAGDGVSLPTFPGLGGGSGQIVVVVHNNGVIADQRSMRLLAREVVDEIDAELAHRNNLSQSQSGSSRI